MLYISINLILKIINQRVSNYKLIIQFIYLYRKNCLKIIKSIIKQTESDNQNEEKKILFLIYNKTDYN